MFAFNDWALRSPEIWFVLLSQYEQAPADHSGSIWKTWCLLLNPSPTRDSFFQFTPKLVLAVPGRELSWLPWCRGEQELAESLGEALAEAA